MDILKEAEMLFLMLFVSFRWEFRSVNLWWCVPPAQYAFLGQEGLQIRRKKKILGKLVALFFFLKKAEPVLFDSIS